ncbi:MAG: tandem-95 repeat protein [Candidatus Delongbacteria bacterium]|nr:tandem-95 repeat protein [Candidatus Delongbacteria bacterium]
MKKMMLALAVGWLVAGIPAMAATRHLDLAPGSITGITVLQRSSSVLEVACDVSALELAEVDLNGRTWYKPGITDGAETLQAGMPDLPSLSVAFMAGGAGVLSMTILEEQSQVLENTPVIPSRGNITRNIDPSSVPYTFGESYQRSTGWPEQMLALSSPYTFRDFQGQTLHIQPFRYDAAAQRLEVVTHLRIRLELDSTPSGPMPGSAIDQDFMAIYERRFANAGNLRYNYLPAIGSMIVVCPDEWLQTIAPFVEWKLRSGRPTSVVPLSETGSTPEAIRAWLMNHYGTDPFAYVVLVGDQAQLPSIIAVGGASDANYGFLSGTDTYPEAIVGRFSAETSEQLQTMVSRTIQYEEAPEAGASWYRRAIGVASAEGTGDDDEYDWEHMDNIRSTLLAGDHQEVLRVYDPEGGTTSGLLDELNQGASLVNYAGHGTYSRWQSPLAGGDLAPGFTVTRVNQLVNTRQWPVVVSVACDNGKFMENTCFAETWLRASNNGTPTGAVAMYAATQLVGWSPPMELQDEFNHLIGNSTTRSFGALCINGALSMSEVYAWSGPSEMQRFVIFGDPSVKVRTTEPRTLTVEHESTYTPQHGAYTVLVPGEPGALAALSINGELAATGITDQDGRVILPLPATGSPVDLMLVVSADNAMPYEATIPQNRPPVLQVPIGARMAQEDTPVLLEDLGSGFTDADGDSIVIFSAQAAATGFGFQFSGQQLQVTPPANWSGNTLITLGFTDFHYAVDASFTLTVTPVNDAPQLLIPFDDLQTNEDTALSITGLLSHFNDPEGSALGLEDTSTELGSLDWNGSELTFTPTANVNGSTTVELTVSDGDASLVVSAFSITILPVNDAPVYTGNFDLLQIAEDDTLDLGDLLLAWEDVDNDELQLLNAEVTPGSLLMDGTSARFLPPADWNGTAGLQILVGDGQASTASGTLSLIVSPVPDAPQQIDGLPNLVMFEDSSLTMDLLLDAFADADGDSLFITDASSSAGELSQNGNTLTLVPAADFNGMIQVQFSVSDGSQVLEGSGFDVQVVPVDDQLVLLNPFAPLVWNEDTSIVLADIASRFHTGDSDTLFIVDAWTETEGMAITMFTDSLELVPGSDWNGSGSLFLSVDDGMDHPLTVEIALNVLAVNDSPFLAFCNSPLDPVSDPESFLTDLGLRLADVDGDLLTLSWYLDGELILEDTLQAGADTTECLGATEGLAELLAPGILHLELSDGSITLNPDGQDTSWEILSTSIDEVLPQDWALDANWPNPFNPSTMLPFSLPRDAWMRLSVYNLQGQRVAVLHEGPMAAGQHQLEWQAGSLASGMYLAMLESDGIRLVRKMTLVR